MIHLKTSPYIASAQFCLTLNDSVGRFEARFNLNSDFYDEIENKKCYHLVTLIAQSMSLN